MRRAAVLALMLLAGGCAMVPTDGTARTQWHVGVVRVATGAGEGAESVSVRTLGLGWDGAAFLGWRAADYARVDPAGCQVMIVVRRDADLASVERLVKSFEGEKPCVVHTAERSPSPPPPGSAP